MICFVYILTYFFFQYVSLFQVFLTSDCPFQISGKIFALLTEIFLNYNFSVEEFIRGIKVK